MKNPKYILNCFVHEKGLQNRASATKIPVEKINGTEVVCQSTHLPPKEYEVGLVTFNSRPTQCHATANVLLESSQPLEVTKTMFKSRNNKLVIMFNKNIECDFMDPFRIFDGLDNVKPESIIDIICKGDNKLVMKVTSDFPIEDFNDRNTSKRLAFKENNGIRELNSDKTTASASIKNGSEIDIKKREGKDLEEEVLYTVEYL